MRLYLFILSMGMAASADAATPFRLPRLRQIASMIPLSVPETMPYRAEVDSVAFHKGKVIHLYTNGLGEVAHIGYHLFPDLIREQYKNTPVFDFLERYLLEIDLQLDEKSPYLRMDIDQVTVTKGSIGMLRNLTPQTDLSLSLDEIPRKMYRVKLMFDHQEVSLSFPMDSQLLLGGNIIDLENMFERGTKSMLSISPDALIDDWDSKKIESKDQNLIIHGGHYQIEEISGDLYLTSKKQRKTLLRDRKSPVRSISNMMLTGMADDEIPLSLRMVKYGNKTDTLAITLQQYVAYCKLEGCKLYFGTKEVTDSTIVGTLFAYNEKYAYTHMLSATIPLEILEGKVSPIHGKVYAYIPLHDITEKYINKKKQLK